MALRNVVQTREEAAALDVPPLVVLEPLAEFLDEHGLGSGELSAQPIGEGHSNVTYLLERGGERFVLRRPPRPPLPPSAHDVLREARLLAALEPTPVRVPRVLAVCSDESLLGVPFYVMEYIEGTVVTSELPPPLDVPKERRRLGEQLIDALVEIHSVDWHAVGLDTFAKHSGYLERQLRRFTALWEHNKTRELPVVAEVGRWLADNMPRTPRTTIVHGDYRLGNVMVANDAPARIVAIFDWEMSTLGDPLADLGYLTVTWSQPGDPETMFSSLSAITRREGFPTRDELIARYAERTGFDVTNLRWYQALALWKAAVFMEGNYKRLLAGTTDDEFLRMFDRGVPELAEAALALTEEG